MSCHCTCLFLWEPINSVCNTANRNKSLVLILPLFSSSNIQARTKMFSFDPLHLKQQERKIYTFKKIKFKEQLFLILHMEVIKSLTMISTRCELIFGLKSKNGMIYFKFPVHKIFKLKDGEPTMIKKMYIPFKEELNLVYNNGGPTKSGIYLILILIKLCLRMI